MRPIRSTHTILAALKFYQLHGGGDPDLRSLMPKAVTEIADDHGKSAPLSSPEIDDLVSAIACAADTPAEVDPAMSLEIGYAIGLNTGRRYAASLFGTTALPDFPPSLHTEGEWTVERNAVGELALWSEDDENLLHGDSAISREEREANAILMAASPLMRLALFQIAGIAGMRLLDGNSEPDAMARNLEAVKVAHSRIQQIIDYTMTATRARDLEPA
ncbi:MAG: hypothetical protein EOP85_02885 [Verrucomicrobiaceae bacterium]|nr:MAG: hypothetical protein EOP85_02885 [Verrucomicrobiaceae bacterium]